MTEINIEHPQSKLPIPDHAKKVFEGIIFDVYQWEQQMFDGSTAVFEKLKRDNTVVIIPILDDGSILLINDEQPVRGSILLAPGGRIDKGEDVLAAAKRELLEETGYTADEYIFWSSEQPISKIEWSCYTLIAKGLRKIAEPHLDPGEKITLQPVSFDEFLKVATDPNHGDKKIMATIFEARQDPAAMLKLQQLLSPN